MASLTERLSPKEIRGRFNFSLIADDLENSMIGHPTVATIIGFGSIIDKDEFDREGPNISDVDCMAIINTDFEEPLFFKGLEWDVLAFDPGIAIMEKKVGGRSVHCRLMAASRLKQDFDELASLENPQDRVSARILEIWGIVKRVIIGGVVVEGDNPKHRFLDLIKLPEPPKNIRFIKTFTIVN